MMRCDVALPETGLRLLPTWQTRLFGLAHRRWTRRYFIMECGGSQNARNQSNEMIWLLLRAAAELAPIRLKRISLTNVVKSRR